MKLPIPIRHLPSPHNHRQWQVITICLYGIPLVGFAILTAIGWLIIR